MSKLLIHESPLQVLPSLAKAIGLNEAIFFQELNHCLKEVQLDENGEPWVRKSFDEWHETFPFWSEKIFRRIIKNLREKGLVITKSSGRIGDRTLVYSIDYDVFDGGVL